MGRFGAAHSERQEKENESPQRHTNRQDRQVHRSSLVGREVWVCGGMWPTGFLVGTETEAKSEMVIKMMIEMEKSYT